MCFDASARPPAPPVKRGRAESHRVILDAPDGNQIAATVALADAESPPGIVILPDLRGLHPYYERLAEYVAETGANASAIDLFGRTAGPHHRTEDFDPQSHMAAATDDGVSLDVSGAVAELERRGSNRIFVLGFCFGGRAALMQGSRSDLAGTISFYGWPLKRQSENGQSPLDLANEGQLRSPALAFFGENDEKIPVRDARIFEEALKASGASHEVVIYPAAPHSFFDRQMEEHQADCSDAWRRILGFIGIALDDPAASR